MPRVTTGSMVGSEGRARPVFHRRGVYRLGGESVAWHSVKGWGVSP